MKKMARNRYIHDLLNCRMSNCLGVMKDFFLYQSNIRDIRRQEQKIDPKDYTIENLENETTGRLPGTIDGQQFIIQNCKGCNISIFDHTASVTIDDCTDCRIFLGPIKSSVFIRDCHNCKLMLACQQFRTRDCKKLDIYMLCVTQPIIESTTALRLGCFQCYYPQLPEQFNKASISIFNNNWSNIHDFTPVPGENNFSLISEDLSIEEGIPPPSTEQFSSIEMTYDPSLSVVPQTLGNRRKPSSQSCLVVFFDDGSTQQKALEFIKHLQSSHKDCVLVQTKELKMGTDDAERVFNTNTYDTAVLQGPVIGLEINGEHSVHVCQQAVTSLNTNSTGAVYITSDPSHVTKQIDNFYNYAELQMAV